MMCALPQAVTPMPAAFIAVVALERKTAKYTY